MKDTSNFLLFTVHFFYFSLYKILKMLRYVRREKRTFSSYQELWNLLDFHQHHLHRLRLSNPWNNMNNITIIRYDNNNIYDRYFTRMYVIESSMREQIWYKKNLARSESLATLSKLVFNSYYLRNWKIILNIFHCVWYYYRKGSAAVVFII